MAPIRTLLADDGNLARDRLSGFPGALPALVTQAAEGVEVLRPIEEERPDLVFLDVQMPGMDDFEVLKALRPPAPRVVGATAHDACAIRAWCFGDRYKLVMRDLAGSEVVLSRTQARELRARLRW